MKELYNCSLLPYNTFGMDVKASRFVEYASVEELRGLWNAEREAVARAFDYEGLILHSAIKGYTVVKETEEEVEVRVGAGEVWDDFVAYTVANGWYGAENLSLIPGEVGASAVQNIGAYGVEAKDLIVSVDTFGLETGEERRFMREECRYAYRESVFKQELKGKYAVTFVTYRLKKHPVFHLEYGNIRAELEKQGCQVDLENVRRIIIAIRQAKLPDPKVLGNAGSFFMNPVVPKMQFEALLAQYPDMPHYPVDDAHVKIPAGWMIDRCGWKGKRVGHAGVHEKQALVLVNCGGATGKEVMHLAEEIVASVRERFGVTIRPEVNYIG